MADKAIQRWRRHDMEQKQNYIRNLFLHSPGWEISSDRVKEYESNREELIMSVVATNTSFDAQSPHSSLPGHDLFF